jgi:hypothetical protein
MEKKGAASTHARQPLSFLSLISYFGAFWIFLNRFLFFFSTRAHNFFFNILQIQSFTFNISREFLI